VHGVGAQREGAETDGEPLSPYDWGPEIKWVELCGRGKLYSQTVIHAAPAVFEREAPIRNGIVGLE